MAPFTIRLLDRLQEHAEWKKWRLQLDPGWTTTGVAMILESAQGSQSVLFAEMVHKGNIKARRPIRKAFRRGRRKRKTRYRRARFHKRTRSEGWIPPFLETRVNQTLQAVHKVRTLASITAISIEHGRFDTQKMQDPVMRGAEYQQGTPLGTRCASISSTNGIGDESTAILHKRTFRSFTRPIIPHGNGWQVTQKQVGQERGQPEETSANYVEMNFYRRENHAS